MRRLGYIFCGLLMGLAIYWLASKQFGSGEETVEQTNTIVTKLEKVFKVVSAEGHFNEVYNYKQTKEYLRFIPSTKKALLMINAKVLMGYDFQKIKYEIDKTNKIFRITKLGKPEILSLEPTYNYYNINDGLLNKFEPKELNKLQIKGKEQIIKAAMQSDLPKIAEEQLQLLLSSFFGTGEWKIVIGDPEVKINLVPND